MPQSLQCTTIFRLYVATIYMGCKRIRRAWRGNARLLACTTSFRLYIATIQQYLHME